MEILELTLLTMWWKGAVILFLALFVLWLLKKQSAAKQRLFLSMVIVALATLPLVIGFVPKWYIGDIALVQEALHQPQEVVSSGSFEISSDPRRSPEAITGSGSEMEKQPRFQESWFQFLLLLWVAGALALLIRFCISALHLKRLWRASQPASENWNGLLRITAAEIGLRNDWVRLRISEEVSVPIVWGFQRPKILVPASMGLGQRERQLILAHELIHVARQDYLIGLVAKFVLLIHWFNPLMWLTMKKLCLSREKACDDQVLSFRRSKTSGEDYAELLLSLASGNQSSRSHALSGSLSINSSSESGLKQRLASLLDMKTKRNHPGKIESTVLIVVQMTILIAFAILSFGESAEAKDSEETKALKEKVAELEKQINDLKNAAKPILKEEKRKEIQQANVQLARERMREDLKEYDREELGKIEKLYQVSNKNWRTPEAKEALEELVKKYKKANRTGCAILYLGQMSEGEEREKYLLQAVDDFSDCYYGDGCQVGGYGRYLLAAYYMDNNEPDKAGEIIEEMRKDYSTATGHKGRIIVQDFPLFKESE